MNIYEITEEFYQINELLNNATDEDGELRDLTESEVETIQNWFKENADHLEEKADGYGKFITNLKVMAEEAENARKEEILKAKEEVLQSKNELDKEIKEKHVAQIRNKFSSTDVCPVCGGKLVLRTAKQGHNAGNQFYGCSNYPRCRYTKK